jgi:NAD(P)-dependent dehydrogenase (short-subunit alcohol dehydrogenase family)
VTGAATGIGEGVAKAIHDAGATVYACDLDEYTFRQNFEANYGISNRIHFFPVDLSDAQSTLETAEQAKNLAGGTIDILVNSAGVTFPKLLGDATPEEFDLTVNINTRAQWLLAKVLAPGMIEQRWGKIINISSQSSILGHPEHAAYCASKAGVDGLTRSMASDWAQYNVQANSISPMVINTPMGRKVWGDQAKAKTMLDTLPVGRFGEVDEVACTVLYLASDASGLFNGKNFRLEGGASIATLHG